ncbi:GTP-binding protein HSR1-like protein [Halovivax asiaticus JCM 14624]|uniref:GTP-binding protein HSR1-like protein n=1 Tax=Halovivax asiaticus JCM 14624 TaxID=1227490 RepID=M0BEH9_9EURY|nr:GTPase [Halovivax asiaticus]ELZ09301.1 GTP-binding protein HSR1-like protein [Halovivax asiaticus JCM 14624]
MIFEDLPTTPTSEELIDKAFSRASRAGRAQQGLEAQQSMLQTAGNIVSDNLENVVTAWPDFEYDVSPFYMELAEAILAEVTLGPESVADDEDDRNGVDGLRQALSRVSWAARQTEEIQREYQSKLRKTDVDTARKHRKQAFARLADVVEQVDVDLRAINDARNALRDLPEINPDEPTIVVAGYPNVGKSSFVNTVTRARGETASYPFTTKGVGLGHLERDHIRYQLVDTPGLLDRPPAERNEIESQAASAIEHLADCVLVFLDPSGGAGYPIEAQLELRDAIAAQFESIEVPVITVANKVDRFDPDDESLPALDADFLMSVETGENVEAVLEAAIDAIDYEPELPFEG